MSYRILHISSGRHYTGESLRMLELIGALIESGHIVKTMVRKSQSLAEACSRRCFSYTGAHLSRGLHPIREVQDIRNMRRFIREFQPHIIHVHHTREHWLAALALRGIAAKIPLIRTCHSVKRPRKHLFNLWLLGRATQGIICGSATVRTEIDRLGRSLPCPVETIPCGVSLHRVGDADDAALRRACEQFNLPERRRIVTCLAEITSSKGQEYLLRALPAVRARFPEVIFLFAYPRVSVYRQKLGRIVKELGVLESVRWLGYVDHLAALIKLSDVGVVSSIAEEAWSRAACEFLAFGVPVVATDVEALSEIVKNGQNGFMVPPRDSDALASAIIRLLENDEERRHLGAAGREMIMDGLTREHTATRTMRFYDRIVRGAG